MTTETAPAFAVDDRVVYSYTQEPGVVRAVSDPEPSLSRLYWVRMEDGYYVTCYGSDLEQNQNDN